MPTSLFQYEMLPTTWFYVSTLIILAVFFKFNRFWSVRNLDLIVLILFTPGMLILAMRDDQWGYAWLFAIGLLVSIRLVFDTVMVRRPLLEPNLTPGGLTFSCFFLVSFVIAALTVNRGEQLDTIRTVRLEQVLTTRHLDKGIGINLELLSIPHEELSNLPPGFLPFHALTEHMDLLLVPTRSIREQILRSPNRSRESVPDESESSFSPDPFASVSEGGGAFSGRLSTDGTAPLSPVPQPMLLSEDENRATGQTTPERSTGQEKEVVPISLGQMVFMMSLTILAHLFIVCAFIYIGHCHFGNIRTGIACATLYLLLPYTNQMVGRLDHLVPGALILWAVALYRRPFFSGLSIGTAGALVFYPFFLVPLWCSFYWRRGWIRFLVGTASSCLLFSILLLFSPGSLGSYYEQLMHLYGKSCLWIFSRPDGFWSYYEMIYRVPVMAAFLTLCFGMILWPAHKNLATLLSCSSLLMLGAQFWQLHQGGLFMAWYLPLLILTIFRPNLEDRVAHATVVP